MSITPFDQGKLTSRTTAETGAPDAAGQERPELQKVTRRLVKKVFGGGRAESADEAAEPVQPTS
ncbi:hypothetical protein ACFWTE_02060 [Nocardiopsis sp. NPDC058631]|uniref:hypothetical protein n=1 Tax=Nocardiopsis sp. NPDC058631 TaxID=3346566 RepID=UPI003648F4A7